jgi:hypothetical protein
VPPKAGKFDPNHRTPEEIKLAKKLEAKIAETDVQQYVDDHIMAAVEDKAGKVLQRTARATLQAIQSVFPPQSSATTNSPCA